MDHLVLVVSTIKILAPSVLASKVCRESLPSLWWVNFYTLDTFSVAFKCRPALEISIPEGCRMK
jgi:hypothetical protein